MFRRRAIVEVPHLHHNDSVRPAIDDRDAGRPIRKVRDKVPQNTIRAPNCSSSSPGGTDQANFDPLPDDAIRSALHIE
jgi:hypothetical protein